MATQEPLRKIAILLKLALLFEHALIQWALEKQVANLDEQETK
ncbi:MAG: hypothetical protein ACI9DO_003121 [Reinekea sp.]|jgi:hypothetical protein